MNVVRSKGAENKDFKPREPVAQKFADAVVFRRIQGEGVEFFLNRTSLAPLKFFLRIFSGFLYQDLF